MSGRGQLIVIINKKEWVFPDCCLVSGGSVWFDGEWQEHVESGAWEIGEWPKDFPETYKSIVEKEVNDNISYGCCGGCV